MAVAAAGVQSDASRTASSYWQSCFVVVVGAAATDVVGQRWGGACHRNAEDCIRGICRPTYSEDVAVATIAGVDGVDGQRVDCGDAAVVDNRCADGMDAVGGDSCMDDGTVPLDACLDGHRDAGGGLGRRRLVVAKYAEDHWQWVHPCPVDGAAVETAVGPAEFGATEVSSLAGIRVPCPMGAAILYKLNTKLINL